MRSALGTAGTMRALCDSQFPPWQCYACGADIRAMRNSISSPITRRLIAIWAKSVDWIASFKPLEIILGMLVLVCIVLALVTAVAGG